jgi:hypothetical protein
VKTIPVMTLPRLIARLKIAGITAYGVEKRTGVSAAAVRRWFNGKSKTANPSVINFVVKQLGFKP